MKQGWTYKKLGECFVSINNGANIKQIKGAIGIPITRIETSLTINSIETEWVSPT